MGRSSSSLGSGHTRGRGRRRFDTSANYTIPFILNLPIMIFIIVANLSVLMAVIYDKRLRKLRNLPLVSLAAVDILIGLICIPLYLSAQYHPQDEIICSSFIISMALFVTASVLSFLVVCVERWIAIFMPLRYNTYITKTCILGLIALAWIVALAMTISLATFEFKNFKRPRKFCKVGARVNKHYTKTISSAYFVVCLVMGFMQFRIYTIVRSHRTRIHPSRERSSATRQITSGNGSISVTRSSAQPTILNGRTFLRLRRGREEAMTLAANTIYLVSIILWTPQIVILLLDSPGPCLKSCQKWFDISRFLMFLNSGINPLIYSIRLREFRVAIKRSLCFLYCSSENQDSVDDIQIVSRFRLNSRRASI